MKSANIAGSRNFLPVHQWPSTGNRPTPSSYPLGGCETWSDQTINKPKATTMITITVAKKNLEWLYYIPFIGQKIPSLFSTSFCWYDKYLVPNLVSPHPVQSLGGPPIPTSAHDYQTVTAGQCRELWCNSAPEAEEFQLGESWWSFETEQIHVCYIILKVLWMHLYHVKYHLWSYQRSSAANIHVVLRFQRCRQVR